MNQQKSISKNEAIKRLKLLIGKDLRPLAKKFNINMLVSKI